MKFDSKFKPEVCVSDDPTRFVLGCMYHDKEAKVVVATTGHYLVQIPTLEDDGVSTEGNALVNAEVVAQARKEFKKMKLSEVQVQALKDKTVAPSGFSQPVVDGQYPDYKRVIPNPAKKVRLCFNATYLAKLATALGASAHEGVVLEFDADEPSTSPITVRNYSMDANAVGVLMQVRMPDAEVRKPGSKK
jgi:DNA polymerase III sliding clamp (beta) subunit (PCNA family)